MISSTIPSSIPINQPLCKQNLKAKASMVEYYRGIEKLDTITPEKKTEMAEKYKAYLKTHHAVTAFFLNLSFLGSSVRGAYIYASKAHLIKDFKKIEEQEQHIKIQDIANMETKYNEYLKIHHFVIRIFMNLCFWRSSAHSALSVALDSHEHKTAEQSSLGAIFSILVSKDLLKSRTQRSFYNGAIRKLKRTLNSEIEKGRKNPKGLIWRIENSSGVQSYLIGTIHYKSKYFIKAKGVQEATQKAETTFTEISSIGLGTMTIFDSWILRQSWKRKKSNSALDSDKLRRETKIKEGESKKLNPKYPMMAIDFQTHFSGLLPFFKKQEADKLAKKVNGEFVHLTKKITSATKELSNLSKLKLTMHWQRGESEVLKGFVAYTSSNCDYDSSDERTKVWLNESLLERIKTTTKPICIGVGLAHCIGQKVSLVEEFEKAGFKVTRFE
jgi:uncharacterized protein YbaP (TraB family)